ncbi:MAG: Gfo/Idh/MocA family oxidoreductase [Pirellulales bacterium]|nr:Gfo/Idh/MocA family oxidoreductase [Pirellulales bacterium]
MSQAFSRRRFLKCAAVAGAAAAVPQWVPGRALGKDGAVAPSERITLGGIGVGNRGAEDLSRFLLNPDVQMVADADLQRSRRERIKQMVDKHYGNTDCVVYRDMEDILQRDDIDAVLITTGDRWHTLASLLAAKAGKDIYCEKPCSMTIEESRMLADGIARYGRVYQAGTQRRSIENFQLAARLAHSGKLGELKEVHANILAPLTQNPWLPAEAEPAIEECDWNRWLGPCPWRPFNSKYVEGGWRGFTDFHGGGILEWGSHTIDLCQFAAKSDDTAPIEFWADDYRFGLYHSDWRTTMAAPKTNVIYGRYANGVKLVMRDGGWQGLGTCSVQYVGTEGWVETGDSGAIRVAPNSLRSELRVVTMAGTDPATHVRNFLDCVKSRKLTRANALAAAQAHVTAHAAYIMATLGRPLKFDPKSDSFPDDSEANKMRSRAWREPWRV